MVVILVLLAAVAGWWFIYSDGWFQSSPTADELNSDLNELDDIDIDENIDAEFQQIDGDINNL